MKTKNIVLSLLSVSVLLVGSNLRAEDVHDGWKLTGMGVGQSSFTIQGPLRVKALYLSTDTVLPGAAGANYALIIESAPTNNAVFVAFTSDKKGIASFFPTTATINSSGVNGMAKVQDYGDDGIYISSVATVWQTAIPSGEALRAFLLWRK